MVTLYFEEVSGNNKEIPHAIFGHVSLIYYEKLMFEPIFWLIGTSSIEFQSLAKVSEIDSPKKE